MHGRKPDPDWGKVVKGTFRPDRVHQGAPIPEKGMPEVPTQLSGREAQLFIQLAEKVDKLRLASPAYAEMLGLAARAAAAIERYEELITEHGDVYKSPKGLLKKNPAVDMKHQAMRDLRLYLLEFGLSPREIGRVSVIPGSENQRSLFEEFKRGS